MYIYPPPPKNHVYQWQKKFLHLDYSESFIWMYDMLHVHCHKLDQTLDAYQPFHWYDTSNGHKQTCVI
jgi:hypothetical protein